MVWLTTKSSTLLLPRRCGGWKVGVLRYRAGRIGGLIRVVHREPLAAATDPTARIAELVADVETGHFDS